MSTPAATIRNHDEVVAAFGRGWRRPHAHAWDDLLAEDVELVQPLLRSGAGRKLWQEELQPLLAFLPDLTGQVTTWAARDQQIFVVSRAHGDRRWSTPLLAGRRPPQPR